MSNIFDLVDTELSNKAFAHFAANELYNDREISFLQKALFTVKKEHIYIGDVGEENNLDVGRFMVDEKGTIPEYRNEPLGTKVVTTLISPKADALFKHVMGGDYWIRRCQANYLHKGNFIGEHIDTYSNLDYIYSIVIQFGHAYEGGNFFVRYNGQILETKTKHAEVLINKCEIPHGVRPVIAGERLSIVFFSILSQQKFAAHPE